MTPEAAEAAIAAKLADADFRTAYFGGGGGAFVGSAGSVTDCTFVGNSTAGFNSGGGGLFSAASGSPLVYPPINGNTFCDNLPDAMRGDLSIPSTSPCAGPSCPADIDGDGEVGINDFLDLLAAWGPCQ